MSVKAVQPIIVESKRAYNNNEQKNNNVSFKGAENLIIGTMDAIDRGGFAASFILQDFLGMAAPRIGAGMYRNHDKTGQLNWDFAKKEGMREVLSGPSAFIIPAGMLYGIKKLSGTANNVPVDFIKGFGETFSDYAKANKETLADLAKTKVDFYEQVFKNVLSTSTNNGLAGEELDKTAKSFAERLIAIEKAPKKGFWKNIKGQHVATSAQDMKQSLLDDFMDVKKVYLGASGDKVVAEFAAKDGKKMGSSFKSFIAHMDDYAQDAIKHVNKKIKTAKDVNIEQFVKTMSSRRSGTRVLSNLSMFLAVVGFYTLIPKLYNQVTKGRDPGLDGLDVQNEKKSINPTFGEDNKDASTTDNNDKKDSKQVAFTGGFQSAMAKVGDGITNSKFLKSISDHMEFSGPTMSMPAMLTLLFGFCLPPRLVHAQSNTDRKEIMFRDVTSFLSILFGAKTVTRICSDLFAKQSGLALNIKPASHNDSVLKKVWHYIWPSGGVQVLDSDRVKANYSGVDKFKNGVLDMFEFVNNNGGNVAKTLTVDKEIEAAAKEILNVKTIDKNMPYEVITKAFEKAKGSEAYEKIVKQLASKGNKLVKRAKTYNSAFGFASTILLVPALMMWISKHCEKMTKLRIAEAKEASMRDMAKKTNIPESMRVVTNKPTMEGFLNKG